MAAALAGASGCVTERVLLHPADGDEGGRARVHTADGSVYAMRAWRRAGDVVEGDGERFDVDRRRVDDGPVRLSLREVSAVEASVSRPGLITWVTAGLIGLTAGSIALGVVCASVSSVHCYGSSP